MKYKKEGIGGYKKNSNKNMVQTKKPEEVLHPSCPYCQVCIHRSFCLLLGAYVYPSTPFICPSLSWAGTARQ